MTQRDGKWLEAIKPNNLVLELVQKGEAYWMQQRTADEGYLFSDIPFSKKYYKLEGEGNRDKGRSWWNNLDQRTEKNDVG